MGEPAKPALSSQFDMPAAFAVKRVRQENYRIKTFFFDRPLPSKPGQFVMLWLPGVNERPMSIRSASPLSLTVANVGSFSSKVFSLKPGEKVGIRGPYGNHFELWGKNVLLVGGGYGLVPLLFLAQEAKNKKIKATVVIGARKKEDVILEDDFRQLGFKIAVVTDDGSKGEKALATQVVDSLLSQQKFSAVYGCGPEKMEAELIRVCEASKTPVLVSVERMMKCGFGVCGECVFGDRLACAHGTIFSGEELKNNSEFGKSYLDWGGRRRFY